MSFVSDSRSDTQLSLRYGVRPSFARRQVMASMCTSGSTWQSSWGLGGLAVRDTANVYVWRVSLLRSGPVLYKSSVVCGGRVEVSSLKRGSCSSFGSRVRIRMPKWAPKLLWPYHASLSSPSFIPYSFLLYLLSSSSEQSLLGVTMCQAISGRHLVGGSSPPCPLRPAIVLPTSGVCACSADGHINL